jgi:hypothetical protein
MKKFVFVSDLFVEQYRGGAELTTEAIINSNKDQAIKINCQSLTKDFILSHKDHEWIICNFSHLTNNNKILICKNTKYSIIEYDYKFCDYRSLEKHYAAEKKECDCLEKKNAKVNLIFYGYAKRLWFMSKRQMNVFLDKVATIKKNKCVVLSSVFSPGDLDFMNSIKDNEKNGKYLILKSDSWIKGTDKAIQFAEDNNLDFELVSGLQYHEMLIKMSTSKGLIFRPLGSDTCPRIVIEAFLLGCDLILNEKVQHKREEWFSDTNKCLSYLQNRTKEFWKFYE